MAEKRWPEFYFFYTINLSYGDLQSFPKKLKFDGSNICKELLIMKLKIINNCPSDTLISLKSNF